MDSKSNQENWNGPFMASDERANYRARRFRDLGSPDRLEARAAKAQRTGVPAMTRGSGNASPARLRLCVARGNSGLFR